MTLSFTVYGVAQPQGSMKAFNRPGGRYPVVTSDNPELRGWRHLVAVGAQVALKDLGTDVALLAGGVRLTVRFYLPRPQSLPKRVTAHVKRPDLDKLVRAVNDALTGIVWGDDSQVTELSASKGYALEDGRPRLDVRVEEATSVPQVEAQGSVLRLLLADEEAG